MAVLERIVRADGTVFVVRGPPYTEEEEDAFYRRYAEGMRAGPTVFSGKNVKADGLDQLPAPAVAVAVA